MPNPIAEAFHRHRGSHGLGDSDNPFTVIEAISNATFEAFNATADASVSAMSPAPEEDEMSTTTKCLIAAGITLAIVGLWAYRRCKSPSTAVDFAERVDRARTAKELKEFAVEVGSGDEEKVPLLVRSHSHVFTPAPEESKNEGFFSFW